MSLSTISPAPGASAGGPAHLGFCRPNERLALLPVVHDAATLPWLRDALAQPDERPGSAAGCGWRGRSRSGRVAAPRAGAGLVPARRFAHRAGCTHALDPITGRCEIGVWPGRVVDDGQWHDWAGIPTASRPKSSAEAVPDWLLAAVGRRGHGRPATTRSAPEREPAIDLR